MSVATWPDCCQRLDELEVQVQSLRSHEAKLLDQVNDLGGDLATARASEAHAWQVDENRDARLAAAEATIERLEIEKHVLAEELAEVKRIGGAA